MATERALLDLSDEDEDILDIASQTRVKPQAKPEDIERIAQESGFISRQSQPSISHNTKGNKRRQRRATPYSSQIGIKIRPEIKEIFQDISDRMRVKDCNTFELAILALCEKEGYQDLAQQYQRIISDS